MRTSVVIAAKDAPENAFVVWRGYEESIAKAKACGFDGVELALGIAEDVAMEELERSLQKHHMLVSCISTGLTFAQHGLYLTAVDPLVRQKAVEAITGLIHLAERHGRLVTLGRARGFVAPGQTRSQAEELLAKGLYKLDREAQKDGVWLAIEPINRYESNLLNSVDEACDYLRRLNVGRVGVMADLFHMNIEDADICRSLERSGKLLRHVHIADSNRLAPGMGHTDIRAVFRILNSMNYQGWVSAEILPGKNPDEMAFRASKEMRRMIDEAQKESDRQ